MHCKSTMTVLAAFSVLSMASAGPIVARQVCGAAPTGSVAQTPLAQPTGITTAADCAAQCKGNPACLAFVFGLVDGVNKCILYSVPASSLPPSTNLVAYDIGCSSFPSVVPTVSNPGGLGRRQTHDVPVNAVPAGSPAPIAQPVVDNLAACLAACRGNPACIAYTFESGVCKLFGPATGKAKRQQPGQASTPKTGDNTTPANSQPGNAGTGTTTTPTGTHANPINSIPAGAPAPIATPPVDNLAACLAACRGNPACIAYTFESGVCKLFD